MSLKAFPTLCFKSVLLATLQNTIRKKKLSYKTKCRTKRHAYGTHIGRWLTTHVVSNVS